MEHELAFLPIVIALLAGPVSPARADEKPLVFADITVIDATGAPPRPHTMVTISAGKIAAIQNFNQERVPKATEVVDGRGKFLIPGLWDMHAHVFEYPEGFLPLFLANGVTGLRVMWGRPDVHERRARIRNGTILGPRMVIASNLFDGPNPVFKGSVEIKDAVEGRAAVAAARKEGADFIKIYSLLPRDAYFAIAVESKRLRIPFAGHVPVSVSLREASDAGQKSVEHLDGIPLASSSQEETLRRQCVALRSCLPGRAPPELGAKIQATFDPQKAAQLYQRLARNHTWVVPNLWLIHVAIFGGDPALPNDPRLKYVPMDRRNYWKSLSASRPKLETAAQLDAARVGDKSVFKIVHDLHDAGVPLLAGTDTPNPFVIPAFSLHDELALLVEAGLTPMEALQAATRSAAQYFGTLRTNGTVEKGKIADLVVLDANPLIDIHNTQRISGVMLGGRYFDRPALDKMLADVEVLANPE